jgi:hypothetical protein
MPEGANELNSGFVERRLTPEGIELFRSAVAEVRRLRTARRGFRNWSARESPILTHHPAENRVRLARPTTLICPS